MGGGVGVGVGVGGMHIGHRFLSLIMQNMYQGFVSCFLSERFPSNQNQATEMGRATHGVSRISRLRRSSKCVCVCVCVCVLDRACVRTCLSRNFLY